MPNKPMAPTALTTTEERSPGSTRQHIGEPFDRERRAVPQRDGGDVGSSGLQIFPAALVATVDGWHDRGVREAKEERTIEQLQTALAAVRNDLTSRVAGLAEKSTAGCLTPEEQKEYAEIVRCGQRKRTNHTREA